MTRVSHEWTEEQIDILKKRFPSDIDLAQLAYDVRHSRPECLQMAKRLGLKNPQREMMAMPKSPRKRILAELKEIEDELSTPHLSVDKLQSLVLKRSLLSTKLENLKNTPPTHIPDSYEE